MNKEMHIFRYTQKNKVTDFEKWLSTNGYYYIKTKDNRPCFKSKLTRKLKEKFKKEIRDSKPKIFSFKSRG